MVNDNSSRRFMTPLLALRGRSKLLQGLLSITGVVIALSAAGAAAAVPPEFSAHYRVSHGVLTLGEAEVKFEKLPDNRYRYSSLTQPTGLTGLIYRTKIAESSEGIIHEDGFRPERYVYDRSGRGAREAKLNFDWERSRVINRIAGDRWQMSIPEDAMDRLVSQLQLMYDLHDANGDLKYHIADGGNLRTYELQIKGEERISTHIGEFDTIRVVRVREDDSNRSTTFWAAPALSYLPVRVDHREHDDSFRMSLNKLKGIKVPEANQRSEPRFP